MKKDPIETVSLARLREYAKTIPSLEDDLLVFEDLKMLPQLKEPRRMNCLIIGVCTKGTGTYLINQKKKIVTAGNALILTEGIVIDQISMSPDCEGVALLISSNFLQEIMKDLPNISPLLILARRHPIFPLAEEEINTAVEYVEIIKRKLDNQKHKFLRDVVRLLILTMIYDLGEAFYRILDKLEDLNYSSTRAEQIFIQFIQMVEHNYKHERRVGWYADQIGISGKYLSETISNTSKKSPNEWIEQYVLSEIRNQLRKTNKKISQIAEELNFPNQSFLGKYFKESAGMSPSEYRKQE